MKAPYQYSVLSHQRGISPRDKILFTCVIQLLIDSVIQFKNRNYIFFYGNSNKERFSHSRPDHHVFISWQNVFFSTLKKVSSVWMCRRLIYYLAEVDHSPFICVFNNGFYSLRLLQVFHGSGTQWRVRRSHQSTNLWANERPPAVIWGSGSSTTAALLLGERTHTRGHRSHMLCAYAL